MSQRTVQGKSIKRCPDYLLIVSFVLIALVCAFQFHDALVSGMVIAGRRYYRFWATREGAPTAYWWTVGVYAASLLLCLFFAGALAVLSAKVKIQPPSGVGI